MADIKPSPLFPFRKIDAFEIYTVEEEVIMAFDGEVTICINNRQYTIESSDATRLRADCVYTYTNAGETLTCLCMTIYFLIDFYTG